MAFFFMQSVHHLSYHIVQNDKLLRAFVYSFNMF